MITIDFETQSEADLVKVGAWAYSKHPTTRAICVCWKVDDQPVRRWWPSGMVRPDGTIREGSADTDKMPPDLAQALMDGHLIEAHNVSFEKSIWENVLDWWMPRPERWRDTMAVAAYYNMPHGLDKLSMAIGLSGKKPEGSRLISKYSKLHLKTAQKEIPDDDFDLFVDYCEDDVLLECTVSDYLGDLPDRELEYFLLDQKVNERGIRLDQDGIRDATAVVEHRAGDLLEDFRTLTQGINPTQNQKFTWWLLTQNVLVDNLQKDYLQELLDDGLQQGAARSAIELRLRINKASTKKLAAMARNADPDDMRARFQTRYHGAGTGRNTGSGFQPLNLNRGFEKVHPDQLVRDIRYRDPVWLDTLYGDAMDAIAKASRHWIQAEPGHAIYAGDFVSVEAVMLACLAGETWKIEAFRNKVKIYELMADKIYNLPPGTVTKDTHPVERQDGKTGELAFGYQGALGAWLKFDSSGRHSDERIIEICRAWRAEHKATVSWWYDLDDAALAAVKNPGETYWARDVGFQCVDDWLSMILPNGKRLWYFRPHLVPQRPQTHRYWDEESDCHDTSGVECGCPWTKKVAYWAVKEGKWKVNYGYGGKWAENATQAVSREFLMPAMKRVERAGYPVILTVYDEVVCEVPNGFGSKEEFEALLLQSPGKWAAGWPISVDAWIGDRYKK